MMNIYGVFPGKIPAKKGGAGRKSPSLETVCPGVGFNVFEYEK